MPLGRAAFGKLIEEEFATNTKVAKAVGLSAH
jgi:hypothetical protein